jgi:membrane protease YdiL (CAAX protease family)
MPATVPLPLLFLGLFALGSVSVGTGLWLWEGFQNKSDIPSYVKPLAIRWYFVVLCGGAFFVIPFLLRLTGLLRRINGNDIERSFYASFAVECVLVLFFVAITAVSGKVRDGLFEGDFSVRLCVREFLKTLPLMLVTGLLWVPILKFLRSCGLPIEVEMQPLMQLLLKGQASVPSLAAIGCSAVILATICEEIFFRGILFRFFCSFLSVPKSLWLSSFVFAAMHGNWAAFLPIAAVGYRLGRSYAESRNLAVSMAIHCLFNAFNFTLAVTYAHCYAA